MVGAFAASIDAASAQEVLSANAVGYIKRTIPAGGGFQTFACEHFTQYHAAVIKIIDAVIAADHNGMPCRLAAAILKRVADRAVLNSSDFIIIRLNTPSL